ncbi:MAG: hypothetical protein M5U27_07180 [Gaiella sp.]|nr:hypothetical protein [Gaiella sp.]
MDFARDGRRISLALLALAALVLAAGAPGAPRAAAIPSGCWLGKGVHAGTFASGPLKARVTSGTIQLHLWVGKAGTDAVGLLRTGGVGKGSLSMSGSKLTLTVVMKGRFDVTGTPVKLVVNGKDTWNGKAVGSGRFLTIPVSLQLPVKGAPLTIVAATPSRVTLRYGKAAFVATRVKTLPKPVGQLCG